MSVKLFDKWLQVVVICLLMGSCQQLTDELGETENQGTLDVKARSIDNQEVFYPLTLYVFSSDGDCVKTQVVKDKDDDVQLLLSEGNYRVVAVSACQDDYKAASVDDWEDVISLSGSGGAGIPLVMGKVDVKVGSNTKGKLDIELANSVTAIDVALSGIPSDVEEVVVTMSPFYSSVNLKGESVEADYSLRLPCTLDEENRWVTETRYLFPGSGKETVLSIWMKKKNGEELTYGYTWKVSPKANQPYHLSGNYSQGLAWQGPSEWPEWEEAEDVKFDFGEASSPDDNDGKEEEPEVDLSALPEIGSIWNGSIVADIAEADESGVDILLMSLDEWDALSSEVEDVISGYSVNDISDWRLPTYEEAKHLQSCFSGDNRISLNERIAEYDDSLYGIDGEERYLCDKSGVHYSFIFAGGRVISKAGTKKVYYLRLVKTYRLAL